ncbi:MAG: hypothetical protein AB1656_08530 [Candidatus Omnitrophota bacterium]
MSVDINETILIVTGSELLPEEKDRPIAYLLKEKIDARGATRHQRAIVVSDRWYMENELFHICPVILVGGPGVNAAAAEIYKSIPVAWSDEESAFVQMAEKTPVKASLWGLNQEGTLKAADSFLQNGYLESFLSLSWK